MPTPQQQWGQGFGAQGPQHGALSLGAPLPQQQQQQQQHLRNMQEQQRQQQQFGQQQVSYRSLGFCVPTMHRYNMRGIAPILLNQGFVVVKAVFSCFL